MRKKVSGYFSVEASYVLPIVLFLYLLIILSALFLYCRCAISQDTFLLCMRAERFSYGAENYGEVIYGEIAENSWSADSYVQERMDYKRNSYPVYPSTESECVINENKVEVSAKQKGLNNSIRKELPKINPLMLIREGRRG